MANVNSSLVVETILRYKNQIIFDDNKIVSKKNEVWDLISEELGRKKSGTSLYSFVCGNVCNVRDLLNNNRQISNANNSQVAPPETFSDSSTEAKAFSEDDEVY